MSQAKFNDYRSTYQKAYDWAHTCKSGLCLLTVAMMMLFVEPLTNLLLWSIYL